MPSRESWAKTETGGETPASEASRSRATSMAVMISVRSNTGTLSPKWNERFGSGVGVAAKRVEVGELSGRGVVGEGVVLVAAAEDVGNGVEAGGRNVTLGVAAVSRVAGG